MGYRTAGGLSSEIWSPFVVEDCANFSRTIDLFSYTWFYNCLLGEIL